MKDFVDATAFNSEQGNRARKLFAAVVLAALDDAIADDRKYGNGPEQIARWARSLEFLTRLPKLVFLLPFILQPFSVSQANESADDIEEITVTARKRRCGWFDGILVRQTIKISGINGIALTKLDVLDELDEIKMCIGYELNGRKIDYLPAASEDQFNIKPVYKTFPGWKTKTEGIRNFKDLPDKAKKYVHALENFVGARISSISTSPEREDTILVEDPFNN